MIPQICGIASMRICRPYLRNHALTSISTAQFMMINSILITLLFVMYAVFYEQENFSNLTGIDSSQYLAIFMIAVLTVVSSIMIVEMQKDNVAIIGFLITSISSILLILAGMMLFGENINFNQILGVALVITGLFFVTYYSEDEDKK